jgi:hypothetical protein
VAEQQSELISRRPAEPEFERLPEPVAEALRDPTPEHLPEPTSAHVPEPPHERSPALLPDLVAEPIAAEVAPMPAAAPELVTMAPEPVTDEPTPPVPANDATPEPLIKPVLVGADEDAPAAEKKRGWWRR